MSHCQRQNYEEVGARHIEGTEVKEDWGQPDLTWLIFQLTVASQQGGRPASKPTSKPVSRPANKPASYLYHAEQAKPSSQQARPTLGLAEGWGQVALPTPEL